MVWSHGGEQELLRQHVVVFVDGHDLGLRVEVVDACHLDAAQGGPEASVLGGLELLQFVLLTLGDHTGAQ